MAEFSDMARYFRDRHNEAVRVMFDSRKALQGDAEAQQRILEALSVPEVTDEQAALATEVADMLEETE